MKGYFLTKNSYYEGLLQDLFCGNDGFFTIFLHFFYQFNQFFVYNNNFSSIFKFVYMKELENCEVVSNLLVLMGGDAKFYSSNKKFISGSGIDYVKNLKSAFELDIELVEKSLIDVKNALVKIDNAKIKEKLRIVIKNKEEELDKLKNGFVEMLNFQNNKK